MDQKAEHECEIAEQHERAVEEQCEQDKNSSTEHAEKAEQCVPAEQKVEHECEIAEQHERAVEEQCEQDKKSSTEHVETAEQCVPAEQCEQDVKNTERCNGECAEKVDVQDEKNMERSSTLRTEVQDDDAEKVPKISAEPWQTVNDYLQR